jgi:hypothetical protein
MATLEAMSSHHNFRPGQQNKLVSEPPIAAPDELAQLVEADQAVPGCARSGHCCGRRAHRGGRGHGAIEAAHETAPVGRVVFHWSMIVGPGIHRGPCFVPMAPRNADAIAARSS